MLPERTSPRWKDYDYTSSWGYFVTICTKDREHYFGRIENGEMNLNDIWKEVVKCRNDIRNHYPNVEFDEFVCMPNHIHWILFINQSAVVGTQYFASACQNKHASACQKNTVFTCKNNSASDNSSSSVQRTYDNMSLQNNNTNWIQPKSWSLGAIIRWFKIGVTKYCKQNEKIFAWQSRYHDHIIRNDLEYGNIKNYIQNNPKKWHEDRFY